MRIINYSLIYSRAKSFKQKQDFDNFKIRL